MDCQEWHLSMHTNIGKTCTLKRSFKSHHIRWSFRAAPNRAAPNRAAPNRTAAIEPEAGERT